MAARQTDECPTGVLIPMGAPFANQVRKEDDTVCTRRAGRGPAVEMLKRGLCGEPEVLGEHHLPNPVVRSAGALHRSDRHVEIRGEVAEGERAHPGVDHRFARCDRNPRGRAEVVVAFVGSDDAGAGCCTRAIASADYHRDTFQIDALEPSDPSHDRGGPARLREQAPRQTGRGEDVVAPFLANEVERIGR